LSFPFLNCDVAQTDVLLPVSTMPASFAGGTKFTGTSAGGAPFDAIGFDRLSSPDRKVTLTQALLNIDIVIDGHLDGNFSPLSFANYANGPFNPSSPTMMGYMDDLAYILTGLMPSTVADMNVAASNFGAGRDAWLKMFEVSEDLSTVTITDPVLETTYFNWVISDPTEILQFFSYLNPYQATGNNVTNNQFAVDAHRIYGILSDDPTVDMVGRDNAHTTSINSTGLDSVIPIVTSTLSSTEQAAFNDRMTSFFTPSATGSLMEHMFANDGPATQLYSQIYSLAFRFDDSGHLRLADPKVLYRYQDPSFVANNTQVLVNWEWQPVTSLNQSDSAFAFVGKTYLSTGEVSMDLNLGLPAGGGQIESIPYTSVEFATGLLTDPIIFTRSGLPNGETVDCMTTCSGVPAHMSVYVVFFETNQGMLFMRNHSSNTTAQTLFNLRFGSSTRPGQRAWKRTIAISFEGTTYSFNLHMKIGVRADSSFPDFKIEGRLGLYTVTYQSGRNLYSRSLGMPAGQPSCTFKVGTICRMNHEMKTGTKTLTLTYE